jgi:hypothetical protein
VSSSTAVNVVAAIAAPVVVVAVLNGVLLHLWGIDTGDPHF